MPGHRVRARQQVGDPVLAPRPQAGDRLILRDAGRYLLPQYAVEEDVRRVPEDLRPDDREHDAHHAEDQHECDESALRTERADQSPERRTGSTLCGADNSGRRGQPAADRARNR